MFSDAKSDFSNPMVKFEVNIGQGSTNIIKCNFKISISQ